MATRRDVGILVLGGVTVLAVAFALSRLVSCVQGPPAPFQERPVPAETIQAIEGTLRELARLAPQDREERLRESIHTESPPHALPGLLAVLESLGRSPSWRLAEAVGYGPSAIKAILDVADARGNTRQVAILFQRDDGGLRLLGVLP